VDCRRLISFPRARAKLMDLAVDTIGRGMARGAGRGGRRRDRRHPFAAWIAERLALPMLYVRKRRRASAQCQIEGEMAEGARVLLVEDLISEGTSKLNFINAIRQAGGVIGPISSSSTTASSPEHREPGARACCSTRCHLWDVLRVAQGLGYFTPEQSPRALLSREPDGWRRRASAAR